MRWQAVHDRLDHTIEEPAKIGLKDAR